MMPAPFPIEGCADDTEKTLWCCSRNHSATSGPVHSSTRKRILLQVLRHQGQERSALQRLGCKEQTGLKILGRQPLVFPQDFRGCGPMRQP